MLKPCYHSKMNYGLKVPKTQQPSKSLVTLYYPHTTPIDQRQWSNDYIQFISIDPAIKNLAIRVERRYHDGYITCLYSNKYCPYQVEIIDNMEVNKVYENINTLLQPLSVYFPNTHYVLIERQLPENYQATRVAQHLLSYFIFQLKDTYQLASIMEVDPKLKGKMLGAPKGCHKNELKAWAVVKATELATQRCDTITLDLFQQHKKKDDLADVLCQIEAFCKLMHLPLTTTMVNTSVIKDKVIIRLLNKDTLSVASQ